jgi:hypothetical protein
MQAKQIVSPPTVSRYFRIRAPSNLGLLEKILEEECF